MVPLLLFFFASAPPLERLAGPAHGRTGAAAMLVETGETIALHGDQHFPMQSVYKLPIGMVVLHMVDQGSLSLDRQVTITAAEMAPAGLHSPIREAHPQGATLSLRDLLRFMVAESDGTASDVLLQIAGGPKRVTGYLRGLGFNGVIVATSEREMAAGEMVQYRNWATPLQMVALLRTLHHGAGLSAASHTMLLEWMTGTTTFPTRIKGLLPAGTVVAHKTGTSGTHNGLTRATNDAGLVTLPDGRHVAIAVFVSDSRASAEVRDKVIADISRAAWDYWGGK